jgi:hypothetical protein
MVVGIAIGRGAVDVVIVSFADVEFATDDGLYARLIGGIDEMHRAENVSMVGHGDRGHAEFLHAMAKLFDVARAIEHGVIGMEMQVDELGLRHRVSSILRYAAAILAPEAAVDERRVIHRRWKALTTQGKLVSGVMELTCLPKCCKSLSRFSSGVAPDAAKQL